LVRLPALPPGQYIMRTMFHSRCGLYVQSVMAPDVNLEILP
jgi:hypothetical protein